MFAADPGTTAVSATVAELNYLDNDNLTAADINVGNRTVDSMSGAVSGSSAAQQSLLFAQVSFLTSKDVSFYESLPDGTGFSHNVFHVWWICLSKHETFYDHFPRTYWKWILVNILEFGLFPSFAPTTRQGHEGEAMDRAYP